MLANLSEINSYYSIVENAKLSPQFESFIKSILIKPRGILDGLEKVESSKIIFRSPDREERRIFSIATALIPVFEGQRGVILCRDMKELEIIKKIIGTLFPGVNIKLVRNMQPYWDKDVPEGAFDNYDLLLCSLHDFIRLKYDFSKLAVSISAICFHDINVRSKFYTEFLSFILRLKLSKTTPNLYFDSIYDLEVIKSILECISVNNSRLDERKANYSLSRFQVPIGKGGYFIDFQLGEKVLIFTKHVSDCKECYKTTPLGISDIPQFKMLNEIEKKDKNIEILYIDGFPAFIELADIILMDNFYLDWDEIDTWMGKIDNILEYLKPDGRIIFIPTDEDALNRNKKNKIKISELFIERDAYTLNFNKFERKEFLTFLFFHKTYTKSQLRELLDNIPPRCNLGLLSQELGAVLKDLVNKEILKENMGKYSCTSIGYTINRYRFLFGYLKVFYTNRKFRGRIKRIKDDKKLLKWVHILSSVSRDIYVPYRRYPSEIDINEGINDHKWELKNRIDSFYRNYKKEPDNYNFHQYLLSQINPKFSKLNPYAPEKKIAELVPQFDLKEKSKYKRERPKGRGNSCIKENFGNKGSAKNHVLLRIIRRVREKKRAVYWFNIIKEMGIPRTTGYNLIRELEKDGKIKTIEYNIVEPRKFDTTSNKIEFRGRPRKYIIPVDYEKEIETEKTCGNCCMFTRINTCSLISNLIKYNAIDYIPNLKIQEIIKNNPNSLDDPSIRLHRNMMGCSEFKRKHRDYEIQSLEKGINFSRDSNGEFVPESVQICRNCGTGIVAESEFRTLKCPECGSKYTKFTKEDGQKVIKVNIDVRNIRNSSVNKISGINQGRSTFSSSQISQKKRLTKIFHEIVSRNKVDVNIDNNRIPENVESLDPVLRKNFDEKYSKPGFYIPRLRATMLSSIFATMELKTLELKPLGLMDDWEIDRCVSKQLEPLIQYYNSSDLEEWRTCERIISKFYWRACKKIFYLFKFKIISRKLLRHVIEFFKTFFVGSKGYTAGNTLVNNVHKLIYEDLFDLQVSKGFGYHCPGAEHVNDKFGFTLDISDLVKKAGIFALIKAIINKQIGRSDVYTILGRQELDVFVIKSEGYRKLRKIVNEGFEKPIFYRGKEISLREGFDIFIADLVFNLKHRDKLINPFVYVPIKEDYRYIKDILAKFEIVIPPIA